MLCGTDFHSLHSHVFIQPELLVYKIIYTILYQTFNSSVAVILSIFNVSVNYATQPNYIQQCNFNQPICLNGTSHLNYVHSLLL